MTQDEQELAISTLASALEDLVVSFMQHGQIMPDSWLKPVLHKIDNVKELIGAHPHPVSLPA